MTPLGAKVEAARAHIGELTRELEERTAARSREDMLDLSGELTAWIAYEGRLKEVATWPFNTGVMRRLLIASLVPTATTTVRFLPQILSK